MCCGTLAGVTLIGGRIRFGDQVLCFISINIRVLLMIKTVVESREKALSLGIIIVLISCVFMFLLFFLKFRFLLTLYIFL